MRAKPIAGTNLVGMTLTEIKRSLASSGLRTLDQIDQAALRSFAEQMAGRRYGAEPLWDAWTWFREGWRGHIRGPR